MMTIGSRVRVLRLAFRGWSMSFIRDLGNCSRKLSMTFSTMQQGFVKKMANNLEMKERFDLLMGALTAQDHKKALEGKRKNIEAEDSAVRRQLWGWKDSEVSDEEMGDQIVLGDIRTENHNATSSPPGIAKTLAAVGLAAAGLGAGAALPIAAYQLFKPDTNVVVQPTAPTVDTDTDTKYGLKIYRGREAQ